MMTVERLTEERYGLEPIGTAADGHHFLEAVDDHPADDPCPVCGSDYMVAFRGVVWSRLMSGEFDEGSGRKAAA